MNKKMKISTKNIIVISLFLIVAGCNQDYEKYCIGNNQNYCNGQFFGKLYQEPSVRTKIGCPDYYKPISFDNVPSKISIKTPSMILVHLGCPGRVGEIVSVSIRQKENSVSIDARIESDNMSLVAYIEPIFLAEEGISEGNVTITVTRFNDFHPYQIIASAQKEITLTK